MQRTCNAVADDLGTETPGLGLIAPTPVILFAFLRGLAPLSQQIVYRSFDFMDYALASLVGFGFALAWSRLRGSRASQRTLGAGFFAVLLVTTPMAWNHPAVFGVNEVTTPAEFEALAVLASLHPRSVTTDQRLASVVGNWFGYRVSSTLSFLLAGNETVAGYDYALVLGSWTTIGAQVFPGVHGDCPAGVAEDDADRAKVPSPVPSGPWASSVLMGSTKG